MNEKKYRQRHLYQRLPDQDANKIVLITGARQTGKTTLAKKKFSNLQYLNFDAPEIRMKAKNLSTYSWVRDIGVAILDEVQKEPEVIEKVKYCFDENSLSFSVLLGSSQLILLKKVRESLAGRVSLYQLYPFMVSEVVLSDSLKAPLLDHILSSQNLDQVINQIPSALFGHCEQEKKEAFEYVLNWGGMPALFALPHQEDKQKWLKDYEYTYLERDLVDLARLHDLEPFRKFQSIAAQRSGQLLNYSELARDVGVGVETSKRYFEYLRLSYQSFFLQPYFENSSKSLIKTPKLYWLDMGMLRQATNQWSHLDGNLFETMVVSEIYKWIKTQERQVSMYFYRTKGGLECDLLLKTVNGFIGIEIKKRNKFFSKDFTALKKIAKTFGDEWLGSLIVYQGDTIEKLPGKNNWAIPAWRLLNPER